MTNHPLQTAFSTEEGDPTRFREIEFMSDEINHARMENYRAVRFEGCLRQQGFIPERGTFAMIDRETWLSNVWAWTH
jgi:hypothetical protein